MFMDEEEIVGLDPGSWWGIIVICGVAVIIVGLKGATG